MLTSPSTTSSQDSSAAGNALTVAADLSAAVASSHQHHHGSATASSSSAPLSPHGHGHHHGHHHDHDHALAAATSEHPDRDADLDPPLFADEDQDMSEGGVPLSDLYHDDLLLTLPPSSELAMLSTQVLLPLNPIDLDDFFAHAHHYHAAHNGPPPYASATAQVLEPAGDFDDEDDDDLYDDFESPPEGTHLLTAMQVSQELELLQDIHDNGGFLFGADGPPDIDAEHMEDQFNHSLVDFLYTWGRTFVREDGSTKKSSRAPSLPAVMRQRSLEDPETVERHHLQGEKCDFQRIDWTELGVSRQEAKRMRIKTYKNYTNLRLPSQWRTQLKDSRLPDTENFFKFRRMDFNHDIHLSHFQLRNLVACASRDHIFYAGVSKVMQYRPSDRLNSNSPISTAMDLTDPVVQSYHAFSSGVQISTMTIAHDILVAGGFSGEYGLVNLRADRDTKHTEGLLSDHRNSITNHVQVHLSRNSSLPTAAFASNDNALRLVDINTNRFIAEHKYEHAINCSAISPDQRLRVLVGDAKNVMICHAETGEVLQELQGHRDFGFACDWADDGWTVATGNQDMQVKIWDARKWTNSQGVAQCVTSIPAEMAGVRKLKFSPCGSGKRLLVAAEPADFVHIINADTYASKQTLSFFGEIGGLDFTNNGQDLFVGNCDGMRGGMLEFERCDAATTALTGFLERPDLPSYVPRTGDGYDWDADDDEVGRFRPSRWPLSPRWQRAMTQGPPIPPF